ncbi:MAG: hypothetical protein O2892_16135 [Actinomycetota bacterium]|nr:hypothetical protein [Actinomycetota bacterium]MDA2950547.1 hypothetical protein [Actinomycetota bacterium]
MANVYGVINNGNFNSVNRPENGMGDILTVTQNAWLSNPTKLAVGQLVTGQGVESGTRIKAVLDSNKQGDRYQVEQCDPAGLNCAPTQQLAIGGGEGFGSGKDPRLTAYTPGSNVSLTWGSSGLLTFHAGILEAFSLLKGFNSYDTKIPLYTMKPRVLFAL